MSATTSLTPRSRSGQRPDASRAPSAAGGIAPTRSSRRCASSPPRSGCCCWRRSCSPWSGTAPPVWRFRCSPTPRKPPGSHGGLLNAIVGTLIQTALGTLIGTPIGLMVGTYLAEYGGNSPLANAVRFVSDVLLSAPSILIGLFIYQLAVQPFGGFSGIAGCLALAVLVIPIVVRTTEDMLRLIPPLAAGGGDRAWRAEMESHRADLLPGGEGRHHDRHPARRSPASPGRPRRCCSPASATSTGRSVWARRWPACR